MSSRATPRVAEGSVFCVPLDSASWVTGVLARANDLIGFAYFFQPSREDLPGLSELENLSVADAFFACRLGLGAIMEAEWPLLGSLPHWERSAWKIPMTTRYDVLTKRHVGVCYDDDPIQPIREKPLATEIDHTRLMPDTLFSDRNVARELARRLEQGAHGPLFG